VENPKKTYLLELVVMGSFFLLFLGFVAFYWIHLLHFSKYYEWVVDPVYNKAEED
jgi:hypothetical protein